MWEIVLSRDYAKWSEENWNNWLHTICRLDSGLGRPKICRFRGRNILAYKCNVTDKKNQDIAFNNTDVVRFDSLLIHISHGFFTAHVFNWFSLFSCFFCLKSKSEGGQNSLGTPTSRQINWLSDQEIDYQLLPSFHLPFKPLGNSIPIAHEWNSHRDFTPKKKEKETWLLRIFHSWNKSISTSKLPPPPPFFWNYS